MPDTIQAGDRVTLKGGVAPEMVVEYLDADVARCVWFDSGKNEVKHEEINVKALSKA